VNYVLYWFYMFYLVQYEMRTMSKIYGHSA
jgi:hypothetical protein